VIFGFSEGSMCDVGAYFFRKTVLETHPLLPHEKGWITKGEIWKVEVIIFIRKENG
jgi:hypothetical protein